MAMFFMNAHLPASSKYIFILPFARGVVSGADDRERLAVHRGAGGAEDDRLRLRDLEGVGEVEAPLGPFVSKEARTRSATPFQSSPAGVPRPLRTPGRAGPGGATR